MNGSDTGKAGEVGVPEVRNDKRNYFLKASSAQAAICQSLRRVQLIFEPFYHYCSTVFPS